MFKSKCCNADTQIEMSPDFFSDNPKKMKVGTCWYKCNKCGKPCNVKNLKMKEKKRIKVSDKATAQALAEFLYKEGMRHGQDINNIVQDLHALEKKWGVKPTKKYVDVWLEP